MTKTRRTYSREFKLEALRLVETSGKSVPQIGRDLGIGKGCLYRWRDEFEAEGQWAFPGRGRLPPEQEELRRLKRENEILRQQRDMQKKSSGLLLAPKELRFQFIKDHQDEFPVIRMCQELEVSPSGYYAWLHRSPSTREKAN
jgi:transposase-like protein